MLLNMINIGKVIEDLLFQAKVNNPEDLIELGSKEAFLRIRQIDSTACIRMLYALEGAILGIKDTMLPDDTKKDLKEFFNSLDK